jgi:cytochrome c oxidase subunit 2
VQTRLVAASIALVTSSCSSDAPSVLSPSGESAQRIDRLWWVMLWISVAVFAVVAGLMTTAIVRRRRRGLEVDPIEPRWGDPFVVIAGVVVPAVILTSVLVVSVRDMVAITDAGDADMTIEVVGHMWWWDVRYPDEAVTANEIHIPVGETVRFEVTSVDVIHSFWVPELAPKIDMIPGRTNVLHVRAERPGTYRGQCAEFCGLQHANMAFFVVAQPAAEFERWLQNEARPAATPGPEAAPGLEVFLRSACVGCHTIRGTEASGTLGPDLTHLASRATLAAGTIENTRRDLAAWISDPQSIKPGAVMPPTELTSEELSAVLDYLESLT